MTIEFRPLQPEHFADADALWEFTRGVVLREDDDLESFRQFLKRNPDCCYGAWQGSDLLVGAIMAGHDGRRGYLYHLAVKSGYRRQGIGRKLIETSLAALHTQGINKVHVFVKRHNMTASIFWKNLSWKMRRDIQVYSFSEVEV